MDALASFRRRLAIGEAGRKTLGPRQVCDNAVVESFYSTLKMELIDRHALADSTACRAGGLRFVEFFYSRQCLHSSLAYVMPGGLPAPPDIQDGGP